MPNLGDLGPDLTVNDLEGVLQATDIPGVRFAASSPPKSSPGTAMAVAKAAVAVAKDLADIVIIDSPPLLLANDAADLSTFADATVLLVRAGWTRHKAVAGAADLLRRLEATTVGVVLVGAEHGTHDGYYGYYGYYGYGYGYGRGESVEDSLRHRLMPWRRPRPRARSPRSPRSASRAGEPVEHRDGPGGPDRSAGRRALGLTRGLSTPSTVATAASVPIAPSSWCNGHPACSGATASSASCCSRPARASRKTLTGTGRALWRALARADDRRPSSRPSSPPTFGADPARVGADIAPVLERARAPSGALERGSASAMTRRADGSSARSPGYGLPGSAPLPGPPLDDATWRGGARARDRRPGHAAARGRGRRRRASPTTDASTSRRSRRTSRRCASACCSSGRCSRRRRELDARRHRVPACSRGRRSRTSTTRDPAQRAFGDVDLLVASADYDRRAAAA